jgi:hypothetical protein
MPPTRRRRRPPAREKGESFPTFLKVLVPLFIMGLAIFQSASNNGHVDNNVIGALVFIALGGAVGYVADRFIQAWLGIGNASTLPGDDSDVEEDRRLTAGEDDPRRVAPPRRKRKHRD